MTQVPPVPPLQHPVPQLVPSQTQPVPVQCWPTAQIAPPLHWQAPPALQALARTASQAAHAVPPVPHNDAVSEVTQVEPLQHPLAQFPALQPVHTWAVHRPAPHDAHAAPFFPHTPVAVPA